MVGYAGRDRIYQWMAERVRNWPTAVSSLAEDASHEFDHPEWMEDPNHWVHRLAAAVKLRTQPFPNLQRTSAALEAFDAAHGPNDPGLDSPLAEAVGLAYGLDTGDRNDPEVCRALIRPGAREPLGGQADLSFVRRMVKIWRDQIALSNDLIRE